MTMIDGYFFLLTYHTGVVLYNNHTFLNFAILSFMIILANHLS